MLCQLTVGLITCIVVKDKKSVLLVLRQKSASLDPDRGVCEVESVGGPLIWKTTDELLDYFPIRQYHRGGRQLFVLKHSPLWSL